MFYWSYIEALSVLIIFGTPEFLSPVIISILLSLLHKTATFLVTQRCSHQFNENGPMRCTNFGTYGAGMFQRNISMNFLRSRWAVGFHICATVRKARSGLPWAISHVGWSASRLHQRDRAGQSYENCRGLIFKPFAWAERFIVPDLLLSSIVYTPRVTRRTRDIPDRIAQSRVDALDSSPDNAKTLFALSSLIVSAVERLFFRALSETMFIFRLRFN